MPLERILAMIRSGEIGRETLIWNEGMDGWVEAQCVAQLENFFPPPLPTVAVEVTEPPVHGPADDVETVQTNPVNRAWSQPAGLGAMGIPTLEEEVTFEADRSLLAEENDESSISMLDDADFEAADSGVAYEPSIDQSLAAVTATATIDADLESELPDLVDEPDPSSIDVEGLGTSDSGDEHLSDEQVASADSGKEGGIAEDVTDVPSMLDDELEDSESSIGGALTLDPNSVPGATSPSDVPTETEILSTFGSVDDLEESPADSRRGSIHESSLLDPTTVPPLPEHVVEDEDEDIDSSSPPALLSPISDIATVNAPPPDVLAEPSVDFRLEASPRLVFAEPDRDMIVDGEKRASKLVEHSFFGPDGLPVSATPSAKGQRSGPATLPKASKAPAESRSLGVLLLLAVSIPVLGGALALGWSMIDKVAPVETVRKATAVGIIDVDQGAVAPIVDGGGQDEVDGAVRSDAGVDAASVDGSVSDGSAEAVEAPTARVPKKASTRKKNRLVGRRDKPETKAPEKKKLSPFARSLLAGPNVPSAKLPTQKKKPADDSSAEKQRNELSQSQILKVIKQYKKSLQRCHERQLKREPLKESRLTLRFRIRASGRTGNVSIGRKYDGTVLKSCLDSLVKRWRFPSFRGEPIDIEYPLIFTTRF
jgi:hypothetical protein